MNKRINNVVIVNNIVAPYRIPLLNEVYRILHSKGIDMTVLFLTEKEAVRDWRLKYDAIQFPYKILPVLFQKRNPRSTTSDTIINTGFFKHLFADRVLIFGYSYITYLIFVIVRKVLVKKTILFSESTLSDKSRANKLLTSLKSILIGNFFHRIVVPGIEAKRFIRHHHADEAKILLAPNAVEPFKQMPGPTKAKDWISLLYVGRLSKEKNVDFMIKNIPKETRFRYKLVVVGSGEEESYLRGLNSDIPVEFAGFLEGLELAVAYCSSDIIILPSSSEAWGLVINEAISLGVVPLVSDSVGCRYELVQGNGEIFRVNDKMDFQAKLGLVSENLARYRAGCLELSREITIEHQAKKLCQVIVFD